MRAEEWNGFISECMTTATRLASPNCKVRRNDHRCWESRNGNQKLEQRCGRRAPQPHTPGGAVGVPPCAALRLAKYAWREPGGYDFTLLVVESYGRQCSATHTLLNLLGRLATHSGRHPLSRHTSGGHH